MKEIWINLELYIKSYEFSILRDFFRIFSELFFIFKTIKINKIKANSGFISARGHVDATWHSRPRGSANGPTRCLRGDVTRIIFTYIRDIIYIFFRLSEENY